MIFIKYIYIISPILLGLVESFDRKLSNPNQLTCDAKNDYTNCLKLDYKDDQSFEIPSNFRNGLIIRSGTKVEAIDPISEKTVSSQPVKDGIINFDFFKDKTLYLSTMLTNQTIISTSKNYPNLKKSDELWFVTGLAVDFISEKVYAYDDAAKKIDVFDIQGKHHGIVLSDLELVKDIALDPYEGLLFILHLSSIQSVNMDGSELEVFIEGSLLTAFTLDLQQGNIYWAQGLNVMMSLSYSKERLSKVTDVRGEILSLAVLDQTLYLAIRDISANILEPATLFRCTMVDNICESKSKVKSFDDPQQIRAYNPTGNPSISNPCENNNGGCEQLCVIRADKIKCACSVGWQLNSDSTTCSPIKEYILYIRGTYVRGRILDVDQNNFVDAIQPKRLRMDIEEARPVAFDYDAHRQFMVFSDDNFMYQVDLSERHGQVSIAQEKNYEMRPAIDWTSDNLYYLRTSRNYNEESYLMLRKAYRFSNFTDQKVIFKFAKKQQPRAIAIYPSQSKIYVTVLDVNVHKTTIYAFMTDDSRFEEFLSGNEIGVSISEISLSIDHQTSRLYWFDVAKKTVQHGSVEGPLDLKTVSVAFVESPVSINIHQEWIYINNGIEVWRVHKLNGESRKKIVSTDTFGMILGAKGYGVNLQPIPKDHPCTVKNGGCSEYCIASYDKKEERFRGACKCNDNQKLAKDGKTCIRTKYTFE